MRRSGLYLHLSLAALSLTLAPGRARAQLDRADVEAVSQPSAPGSSASGVATAGTTPPSTSAPAGATTPTTTSAPAPSTGPAAATSRDGVDARPEPTGAQPAPGPATSPYPRPTPPAPATISTTSPPPPPEGTPSPEGPAHPARVRWGLDAGITLGAAGTFFILEAWVTPQLPADAPPSMPTLSSPDDKAVGHFRPNAALASDVFLYSSMAAPLIYHGIEAGLRKDKPFGLRYGTDVMIYAETLALNLLITEILKNAIGRPRPLVYVDPDAVDADVREKLLEEQASADSLKSFPSGHASTSFAAAVGGSMLLTLKLARRRPGALAAAWVLSLGAASTAGALRVVAGKHFTSDVIAGAILGSAIGVVVPLAHWRGTLEGAPRRRRRATMQVAPAMSETTRGLVVTGRF
ncbi:MAG: phosphatase PAP2 family protein [Myxococcales bacterium]|nr:phosphatase PAP2 family protein [Myxococcales bacterium]